MSGTLRQRWEAANFRRWLGPYFLASVAVFALGTAVGGAIMLTIDPSGLAQLSQDVGSIFPDRITFSTLVVNNLLAVGVTAFGLVSFGIVAALSLFFNGFIVGLLLGGAARDGSFLESIALVVPHGWLELSMFWLVGALSFRVTHRLVNYLRRVDETPITRQELFEIGVLLVVAALGIVVAAWIEATLTVDIARALVDLE